MNATEPPPILELSVVTTGEITVTHNLSLFRESVETYVAGINLDLKTDLDFGRATSDVKTLKALNEAIKTRKAEVLAQASEIQSLMSGLDDADQTIAKARLTLERQIKTKTEEVKAQIVTDGLAALVIAPRLRPRMKTRFEEAIKGKRMLESMREAVMALAVEINQQALEIRDQVAEFRAEHGGDLLPDAEDLEIQSPEVVATELRRRLEGKRHREEAERLKKEKEDAEAKAKEAAEQAAPAPTAAQDVPWGAGQGKAPQAAPAAQEPRQLTPAQEWDAYLCAVRVAAGQIKDARLKLWHDQNIRAAKFFAGELREALDQASEMASGKEGA